MFCGQSYITYHMFCALIINGTIFVAQRGVTKVLKVHWAFGVWNATADSQDHNGATTGTGTWISRSIGKKSFWGYSS